MSNTGFFTLDTSIVGAILQGDLAYGGILQQLIAHKNLVFLEMLVEQTVHGHIVAIHHQAVGSGVHIPPHTAAHAVVGTPNPEMVAHHIVAVDFHRAVHVHGIGAETTDAEKEVRQQHGLCAVINARFFFAHLKQRVGAVVSVKEQRGHGHVVNIVNHDGTLAVVLAGNQSCPANAEHHGAGAVNAQRLIQRVHAGGNQQIAA